MKLAFFSDLHACSRNLSFLLGLFKEERIDKVYNLGDAVGYAGDPNETFRLLRSGDIVNIIGNHDLEASFARDTEMKIRTKDGREVGADYGLEEDHRLYIRGLSKAIKVEIAGRRFAASHGHITAYGGGPIWESVTPDNMDAYLEIVGTPLAFVGNSHEQYYLERRKGRIRQAEVNTETELTLRPDSDYVISVGSAAAPSGNPPKPGFVVYEPEAGVVTFRKFEATP